MATAEIRKIECPTPGDVLRLRILGSADSPVFRLEYEPNTPGDGAADTAIVAECVE
jgi:hypothetical protein